MDGAVNTFGIELEVHIASLRRYARALVRQPSDADDLVQETLARALSRADKFVAGTNLRAWLFTIMHNLYVNQVRSRASRPREVPIDDVVEARLGEPAGQEAWVELGEMMRVLDALPEEQRQVLLLVALEGMKYEEAAKVLEVPVGTVMSRLSRAREAVRVRMAGGVAPMALRRVK